MDRLQPHRILPEASGRIHEILFSVPRLKDFDSFFNTYGGVLEAFPGTVKFLIVSPPQDPTARKNFKAEFQRRIRRYSPHEQLLILEQDSNPTQWVQDPFVVLELMNQFPVLVEPFQFGDQKRGQDQHLAEQISTETGYFLRSTKLKFEGGNLIGEREFVIIGKDTLMENIKKFYGQLLLESKQMERAVSDITTQFKETFGVKDIVWSGLSKPENIASDSFPQGTHFYQPFFHLDLYMTAGGKTKFGDELIFIAEIDEMEINRIPESLRPHWKNVATMLNEVTANLELHHTIHPSPRFVVERIPMGLRKVGRSIFPLSFNNCLIENYQGVKVAYIPKYAPQLRSDQDAILEELHQRVEDKFTLHGYAVKFVRGDFYDDATSYSSLHCISKVTKRIYL